MQDAGICHKPKIRATARHAIKIINARAVFRRMEMQPDSKMKIHLCDDLYGCLCDSSSGWIDSRHWNGLKAASRRSYMLIDAQQRRFPQFPLANVGAEVVFFEGIFD